MSSRPGLGPASRVLAVAIAGTFFFDATARSYSQPGLSTFGRPPELAALWAALGVLSLLLIGGARERLLCARRLSMLVLLVCLFDGRAVGGAPELSLALVGVTLFIAAPLLRPGLAGAATLAVLVCSLPSVLGTPYPEGAVHWLTALLPPASLAVLIPSLFPGRHIRRVAIVFAVATAVLAAASLTSYLTLAHGIGMPLGSLLSTRLRPMGMHPNLAVPQLLTALLIACGLAWNSAEPRRGWALASAAILAVTLGAVQSRTGAAAAFAGLALLAARRFPIRTARLVHPIAVACVILALLVPVTGVSRGSIQQASADKTQKAVSFRSAMWRLGNETFRHAPWYGFGPESTYRQAEFARPSRYDGLPKDDHPHSVVLAVGNAFGWPGLLGLAALLAVSVRRRSRPSLLSDAASAAILVTWASDAMDMGGAIDTLFPSLVFLGLGIQHAADRTDDEPVPAARPVSAAVTTLGIVLVLAGACGWGGWLLVDRASTRLDSIGALPDGASLEEAALRDDLELAARLRPFDPGVPLLLARLASLAGQPADQVEQLREARRLHSASGRIAHELAVVLGSLRPDDDEVLQLLQEAVRRDPLGPASWRSLMDLAIVQGGHGDAAAALDSMVAALTLNPAAIQRVRWNRGTDRLTLGWEGTEGVSIPLSRVLLAVARQRNERGEGDPATLLRLQLREVEIYNALGDYERAEAACHRILADEDYYRSLRLVSSALLQEDYDRAIEELAVIDYGREFQTRVSSLTALSEATRLDAATFDAVNAQVEALLPDVVFESESVRRVLQARQRIAERLLQPEQALIWSDAQEYASR